MKDIHYIQIGVTAQRTPTGEFLPSVPLFVQTSEKVKSNGLTAAEEATLRDVAHVIADAHNDGIVEVR